MSDPGPILILGAGATGLGAAWRLQQVGFSDYLVLERRDKVGGLASSFLDPKGFTWDIGGHIQFSHYPEYDRMLDEILGDQRLWHERQSWVWLEDRFVPYPFQHNLHRLAAEDRQRVLAGLEAAAAARDEEPANFRQWIESTFGSGIAETFMLPYNEKVWGHPLETLGTGWIADRVAPPDLERIRSNLDSGCDDSGWGPNSRFSYPLTGGTGSTWQLLADRLEPGRLELGAEVIGIDLAKRSVTLRSGRCLTFGTLISSLPLDRLGGLCRDLDPVAAAAARSLVYSSCHILGVGLEGPAPAVLDGKCWIYFPSRRSPYYRVTVLSHYSPNNAPPGCWSLLAEVCETPHRGARTENLADVVLKAMRHDRLIPSRTEVKSLWHRREERGYPTPTLGRDGALARVLPALEEHGVFSRGRFGAWKYEVSNQDHSFMQGRETVDRILGLGEEVTMPHPEIVNRVR